MTRLKYMGNLACIGGGGGGAEGEEGDGDGNHGEVGEAGVGVEAGDGGDGSEDSPIVTLRAISSPAPRSFSGVVSSIEDDL